MELHQLQYLVAVVEHGSFTAAADAVHVTQSGVSAQVAKLEAEVGQRLLERGRSGVRLTAAGEAVLPVARAVLGGVEEIRAIADDLVSVVRGRVALGMVRGCAIPAFLDVVADFGREHPGVDLRLVEDDSEVLCRRVLDGELDLALIAWSGELDDHLDVTVLLDEAVAVVVPDDHKLARRRADPRVRDLRHETVFCLGAGTGIRAAVDATGVGRIDLEASAPATLLGLVGRGVGVALLTATMASGDPGLVARPLADARARSCLGVVRRRLPLAPAARVLHAAMVTRMEPGDAQPVDAPESGAQHRP